MNGKNIIIIILLVLLVVFWVIFKNYFFTSVSQARSVVLTKEGFSPSSITIKQGDTVIFTTTTEQDFWPASDLHPTHGIYPEFDPREPIESDSSWSFRFTDVGDWRFHNHLNSLQMGTIKVLKDSTELIQPKFEHRNKILPTDTVIKITENGFQPATVSIKKGMRVVWINESSSYSWPASNPHPMHTNYPEFDPGEPLQNGEIWALMFERAGNREYHDHLKPSRRGTIKISSAEIRKRD